MSTMPAELGAEAAADGHPVHVDLAQRDAQRVGQVGAHGEVALRARPDGHLAVRGDVGHRRLGLDVGLVRAGDDVGVLEDAVGRRRSRPRRRPRRGGSGPATLCSGCPAKGPSSRASAGLPSSLTRAAPSLIASRTSTTGGSSSYSTLIRSQASSAISRVTAATAAIFAPWYFTLSPDVGEEGLHPPRGVRLLLDHDGHVRGQGGAGDHGHDARQAPPPRWCRWR